jgi:hypothetical protein
LNLGPPGPQEGDGGQLGADTPISSGFSGTELLSVALCLRPSMRPPRRMTPATLKPGALPSARSETLGAGYRMPVRPRMQGWPSACVLVTRCCPTLGHRHGGSGPQARRSLASPCFRSATRQRGLAAQVGWCGGWARRRAISPKSGCVRRRGRRIAPMYSRLSATRSRSTRVRLLADCLGGVLAAIVFLYLHRDSVAA